MPAPPDGRGGPTASLTDLQNCALPGSLPQNNSKPPEPPAWVTSRPVDLGDGFAVEFRFVRGGILCEWSREVPKVRTPNLVQRYLQARDQFISDRFHLVGTIELGTPVLREATQ